MPGCGMDGLFITSSSSSMGGAGGGVLRRSLVVREIYGTTNNVAIRYFYYECHLLLEPCVVAHRVVRRKHPVVQVERPRAAAKL